MISLIILGLIILNGMVLLFAGLPFGFISNETAKVVREACSKINIFLFFISLLSLDGQSIIK